MLVQEVAMPLIIITLTLAVVLGRLAPRRIALTVTAAAATITLFAHIWTTVDGKGQDPWWTALVGGASAAVATALCERVSARRSRPAIGTIPSDTR
jgi:uncharacterized membrane protein YfcA